MSTRITIQSTDEWHLYEEGLEEPPDDVYLSLHRRDYDGTYYNESFKIPWKAALALHKHVEKELEHENKQNGFLKKENEEE